jgi:hypothetical protein
MKYELICKKCGGKRFVKRGSRWEWEKKDISIFREYFECMRCHSMIKIVYKNE